MHRLPQQLQPSFEIPIILWLPSSAAQSCRFCVHKCTHTHTYRYTHTHTHTHTHTAHCVHTLVAYARVFVYPKRSHKRFVGGGYVCRLRSVRVWNREKKILKIKVTGVWTKIRFPLLCSCLPFFLYEGPWKLKVRWVHTLKTRSCSCCFALGFQFFRSGAKTSLIYEFVWERERQFAKPVFLRATRAELLVWVWTRKVNITMSHNPLLLCSRCGILTKKCQRSQHWFIRIPNKTSHMPLSGESEITDLNMLHCKQTHADTVSVCIYRNMHQFTQKIVYMYA